jgi:hypothetical protein
LTGLYLLPLQVLLQTEHEISRWYCFMGLENKMITRQWTLMISCWVFFLFLFYFLL